MQFPDPPRRRSSENIIPMINVVFLLLIFFLMTAEIAPPEPFATTPPVALGQEPSERGLVLHIGPDGVPGFDGALGEAAMTALGAASAGAGAMPVTLRADAALPAGVLAALLPRLAAMGVDRVDLVTAR